MCYSAQIEADYRKYVKMFGADIEIIAFTELFFERVHGSKAKVPKGVEDAFAHPATDGERKVKALIDEFNAQQVTLLEQDLFKQRERLARAERALQTRVTKAASESRRIATDKVEQTKRRPFPNMCKISQEDIRMNVERQDDLEVLEVKIELQQD